MSRRLGKYCRQAKDDNKNHGRKNRKLGTWRLDTWDLPSSKKNNNDFRQPNKQNNFHQDLK